MIQSKIGSVLRVFILIVVALAEADFRVFRENKEGY